MGLSGILALVACGVLVGAAACSSSTQPEATATSPSGQVRFGSYPEFHDEDSGLTVIFGTPDLGPGSDRLAFAITDTSGFVRLPIVSLATYYYPDGPRGGRDGPVETLTARFHEFPFGTRGSYVAFAELDSPGLWGFEASFPRPDGTTATTEFQARVLAEPMAPAVGALAPASDSPTIQSRGSYEKLTTAGEPDPALYQTTIADAVTSGKPTVTVFTSPAFCTTPLCGPEVEVVSALHARYGDQANFIHVDLYDAPDEIKGDLSAARRSAVVAEWRLQTDEWTFVIGGDGRIVARFESFAGEDEISAALDSALANS